MKVRFIKWDGYYWAEFQIGKTPDWEIWSRWFRPYLSLKILKEEIDKIELSRPIPRQSEDYSPDEVIELGEVV